MKHYLKRLRYLPLLAPLALALASCTSSPLFHELVAESYSISRYTDYAPVTLHNVTNPGDRVMSQVVFTASCTEDQFESLKHKFRSAPVRIEPGQTLATVELEYHDGWPYFTRFRVGCRFDATNERFPIEPQAGIRLR